MNELLTALEAAAKVGFDAPECPDCHKSRFCPTCRGTFLDASDPEKLIGRAERWLWVRHRNERAFDPRLVSDEAHAAILLRLVAQTGGAP